MIKVRLRKRGHAIVHLSAEGHSGYGPSGTDIVCSGVSSLMQALEIGLRDVLKNPSLNVVVDEKRGFMSIEISSPDDKTDLLFRTIKLSLIAMEENYPLYLNVTEVKNHDKI